MAWRIAEHVTHGELDNRTPGRVTGTLWLAGRAEPLRLVLKGNARRDWAGCVLRFRNPRPAPADLTALASEQVGECGDMTASRKVRMAPEDVPGGRAQGAPNPESLPWGNAVYLEWVSETNGRVVIESARYEVETSERAWSMTEEEDREQSQRTLELIARFLSSAAGTPSEEEGADAQSTDPDGTGADQQAVEKALELMSATEELKKKARELAGGDLIEGSGDRPVPLDVQHQFWKNIVAFESASQKSWRDILAGDGFHAAPEEGLSDAEVTSELWQLITALAARRAYLEWTDHLSDRELYRLLVKRVLDEETEDLPPDAEWNCRLCIHEYGGPGKEDGTEVFLRYYADEETRAEWAEDFPGELPPQCELPYDRDRHLPKSE